MFREARRKWYRKVRFKTWFRKVNHYNRRKHKINFYIEEFRGPEALKNKKYARRLRRDMIYSLFRYGSYFDEYFLFGYEGASPEKRASFITEGIRMSYYPRMNNPRNTNMLENKFLTYKKFKDYFAREMICIRKGTEATEEKIAMLADFASRNEKYIVKPIFAAFGKGVHFDSLSNFESLEAAFAEYAEKGAVIEEIIEQDERMGVLHPQSVNTLRVPTVIIKNENGEPEVRLFNPTVRIGQSGSIIDNVSAGGLTALIDPETGVIKSDGADKKGQRCECHPDTGVRFKGFQIPDWDRVREIVTDAALSIPDNHYCGWDLALSKKHGWCMVEANCTAQMGGMQFTTQEGRKAELEALIEKM